jgi:predicted O-methyltransferase YrrM
MISSMAIERARTLLDEWFHWPEFMRARERAAIIWSALRPKLQLNGDVAPLTKRQIRFAKNVLAAGLRLPLRYLEVGSYEGASLAFVHDLLEGRLRATIVDPFENYSELPTTEMSAVEARFQANIKATGIDARVLRGSSIERLPQLIAGGEAFDLIYIDGSHAKLDVITDALLCWRLLAPGGLMIFDDYRMPEVGAAVDTFVRLVRPQASVVNVASQVFVRHRNPARP